MTPFDPLEDALRHPPHLDGADFTAGVIRALPRARRERAIVLAAGGLASAGAAAAVLAGPLLPLWTALAAPRLPDLGQLLAALLVLATPIATTAVALGADRALRAP